MKLEKCFIKYQIMIIKSLIKSSDLILFLDE